MSAHTCHALHCTAEVPPRMHMCRKHWYMAPKHLRDEIWATYVPGQERRKDPTAEYLVAAERCITAVALIEGHLTDAEASERLQHLGELVPRMAELLQATQAEQPRLL